MRESIVNEQAIRLREATAADSSGVIALVEAVYREYGEILCLENADADLLTVPDCYTARGGAMVVLESSGAESALNSASAAASASSQPPPHSVGPGIVGAHAVVPLDRKAGVCTFRRLYMAPGLRGTGWGSRLMGWAVEWALAAGFTRVEFWSDTRFERAHRFFARCGLQQTGEIRVMHDGVVPYREYAFHGNLPDIAPRLSE